MAKTGSGGLKTAEGDLISIQRGNRTFTCKVLYSSEIFRDVILLAVFRAEGAERGTKLADREPDLLIYTSAKCLGREGWEKIGFEPVLDSERQRSRRIVGGEIWLGDREIGPASGADSKKLPRMQVAGCLAVEIRLDAIL